MIFLNECFRHSKKQIEMIIYTQISQLSLQISTSTMPLPFGSVAVCTLNQQLNAKIILYSRKTWYNFFIFLWRVVSQWMWNIEVAHGNLSIKSGNWNVQLWHKSDNLMASNSSIVVYFIYISVAFDSHDRKNRWECVGLVVCAWWPLIYI